MSIQRSRCGRSNRSVPINSQLPTPKACFAAFLGVGNWELCLLRDIAGDGRNRVGINTVETGETGILGSDCTPGGRIDREEAAIASA